MSALEKYFDRIFVISLESRPDRWAHFINEMNAIGVTKFERFLGYERPFVGIDLETNERTDPSGNMGCTASHRALLELIAFNKWDRVLVLEDDVKVRLPEDFNSMWKVLEPRIPSEWDMLYLGGHYGEDVLERVNPNILRCGRMLTTSSYGITWQMARRMAPYICGIGPIDSLFGWFHPRNQCFCLQPRLMVQYTNFSDLQDREMNNELCMTDRRHESMLPASYVGAFKDYVRPAATISAGKVRNPSQHPK